MRSFKFKEVNKTFAEGDEQYKAHAFVDPSINGQKDIVTCYTLTWREKLMIILTGKVWVNITSVNGLLRPMRLSVIKKEFLLTRKQGEKKAKKEELRAV